MKSQKEGPCDKFTDKTLCEKYPNPSKTPLCIWRSYPYENKETCQPKHLIEILIKGGKNKKKKQSKKKYKKKRRNSKKKYN